MARHIITIAGRRFVVDDDGVVEIRRRLIDAMRNGGDFVGLRNGAGDVDVLVSPGMPVFVERLEEPEIAVAGAATVEAVAMPVDEFDEWGI